MRTTAVLLDDDVYEQIRACSAAAGQTVSEWLNEAARRATRQQNAATYVAWESAHYRERRTATPYRARWSPCPWFCAATPPVFAATSASSRTTP